MLIVNTPICPGCGNCMMTRDLSTLDRVGMLLSVFIFFPLTIWIYLPPRSLFCQGCGKMLSAKPTIL